MKTAIRLDKVISTALVMSRRDAAVAIKKGRVTVDKQVIRIPDAKINPEGSEILFDSKEVRYSEFIYLMLNKPQGLICSTEDKREKTVLSLFPESYAEKGIFPAGRLDKDTVGLLIVTNDGVLSHSLLSPKFHAEKKYYVECDKEFADSDVSVLRSGVLLDGKLTKPALLAIDPLKRNCGTIILTEGKYHEIKRLCERCGKTVTFLERIEFGGIDLDPCLKRGEWRALSDAEILILKKNAGV